VKENWKERFANYEKAFEQLSSAIEQDSYSALETAGLIKTFEFTFELAWKTLKGYMEAEGFIVPSPRRVIKQAFQEGFIDNGSIWLDALEKRNIMSHTYNEERSQEAINLIKNKYFFIMRDLYFFLKKEV